MNGKHHSHRHGHNCGDGGNDDDVGSDDDSTPEPADIARIITAAMVDVVSDRNSDPMARVQAAHILMDLLHTMTVRR